MRTRLLEILREIPDHRRVEGRRFDLATVLLYSIVAMVGGANSYRRCMSSSASIASLSTPPSASNCVMRRLTRACGSSCTASIPAHWRAPFGATRRRSPSRRDRRASGDRGGRQTLRGSFDAFCDRKAAHMMTALRHADQIVLAHVMVAEKSNEIPTAPELIEALGVKDRLFTLDAEHCQKNRSRA